MPNETYVQVAPDGAGKKIRNLEVQTFQEDGTFTTVLLQVVSMADEFGNPVFFADQADWQVQLLNEMRAVRLCLEALYNDGQLSANTTDFIALAENARE